MPLWGRDCPGPALAVPVCLSPAGDGPVRSQLALLSPLFCEQAWQCLRLGLFWGSRHSYPTVWVAILSLVPSDCLRAFRPGPYPKQCSRRLPVQPLSSPHLLVGDVSVWAAAPLGVAVRHVICVFKLFIYFSSQLFCPLRFQGSPQIWRECFLVFENFSLF